MSKEAMNLALKRAFVLGQDYWYQADHESYRQNKKADETLAKFRQLVDETCEALAKPDFWEGYVPEPVKPAQQEPVAYIHRQGNHYEVSERFLSDDEKSRGWTEEPLYTSPPAQRTWEEWFKWWRTSKVADSTEAEIDFADFMLIVRAVESEYGIKEST